MDKIINDLESHQWERNPKLVMGGLEQSPSASDRCNSLQKALVTAHADLLQYISPVEPVLNLHNPDSTLPEELQLNKEQLPEFALRIGGSCDAGLVALGITNHAYSSDRGRGSKPINFCICILEVFSLVYVNVFVAVILLVLLFFFVCL